MEAVLTSACHQFSNHLDHMVDTTEPVVVKSEMEFQPDFVLFDVTIIILIVSGCLSIFLTLCVCWCTFHVATRLANK